MKYKFKSLKQRMEWQLYLKQTGQEEEEAVTFLIDREIKNNKDLNKWSEKMSKKEIK